MHAAYDEIPNQATCMAAYDEIPKRSDDLKTLPVSKEEEQVRKYTPKVCSTLF